MSLEFIICFLLFFFLRGFVCFLLGVLCCCCVLRMAVQGDVGGSANKRKVNLVVMEGRIPRSKLFYTSPADSLVTAQKNLDDVAEDHRRHYVKECIKDPRSVVYQSETENSITHSRADGSLLTNSVRSYVFKRSPTRMCLSLFLFCLCCLFVCLFVCLFSCLLVGLFACLLVCFCLFVCLFVCLLACLFHLFVCLLLLLFLLLLSSFFYLLK